MDVHGAPRRVYREGAATTGSPAGAQHPTMPVGCNRGWVRDHRVRSGSEFFDPPTESPPGRRAELGIPRRAEYAGRLVRHRARAHHQRLAATHSFRPCTPPKVWLTFIVLVVGGSQSQFPSTFRSQNPSCRRGSSST